MNEISPAHIDTGIMSINVDKMDSKHNDSLHKPKPVMKRRKKNSSTSDLSCDSMSPKKKHIPNGFPNDYRSSPETVSIATSSIPQYAYHNSSLADSMATSIAATHGNGHLVVNTAMDHSDELLDRDTTNLLDVSAASSLSSLSSASSSSSSSSSDSPSPVNHLMDGDSTSSANTNQRQPRTPEDFYLFCQFILEYANYNEMCDQESLRSTNHSPLDSTGSAAESTMSSAVNDESNHAISNTDDTHKELSGKDSDDGSSTMPNDTNSPDEVKKPSAIDASSTNEDDDSDIDAESYNLVTCYCGKPYAARPMIECSRCLTWLHLSCAKIKRKKIPDIFICVKCAKSGQSQSHHHHHQQQQQEEEQEQQQPLLGTNDIATAQSTPPSHAKGQSNNEPKENNRSKKAIILSNSQIRADKLETSILQPLNVSATAYETGGNNLENIKTAASTVSSIAVKYK